MVHRFAALPHAGHFVLPCSMAGHRACSNGIASDLAPAEGARSSCGSDLSRTVVRIELGKWKKAR
jgi:hypothetical protein